MHDICFVILWVGGADGRWHYKIQIEYIKCTNYFSINIIYIDHNGYYHTVETKTSCGESLLAIISNAENTKLTIQNQLEKQKFMLHI